MSCITLMTDFGIKDGNVGVMRGIIWGIAPGVDIADLSHMIGPQNVTEASIILSRSAFYFPPDTVHVVVVDPGVGTQRRPIAARVGHVYFVGPDNGLVTLLLERAEKEGWPVEIVHLDRPRYWLPDISHVFHGRDIFSPVAAHLAKGVPLRELGTLIDDPVRITLPRPEQQGAVWHGQVTHIDHFGNISTNLRSEHLSTLGDAVIVHIGGHEIPGLVRTFGERASGELVALFGSTGSLIVSVVNGSAAAVLPVKVGDPVRVEERV